MNMFFEDFCVGQSFDIPAVQIEEEKIIAFAKEYDPLPIHMDKEYAAASRFKKLLAPGVMTFMSIWSQFVQMAIWGDNMVAGISSKIEWFDPVFVGDTISGIARITHKERKNAYNGIIEITVDITNQDGVKVITDTTRTVIKAREVLPGYNK